MITTFIENSHPEIEERTKAVRKSFPCDETLRAQLMDFRLQKPEWNNPAIAAEVGYNSAVISEYLNLDGNKYSGRVDRVERRIREFLRDQTLMLDTAVETILCEVAGQVSNAIEEIRTAKRIGVITGPPGIGKSRGTNLYCASHERAILFTACTWERNLNSAIECLLKAADVTRGKNNPAKTISEKLKGSSRPILVDDAHKLTCAALQFFYDLRDATGSPIALIGDSRLEPKLASDGQRLRRTGVVFKLKIKNPKPLIEHHIRQLIPDAGGEMKDLMKLCEQIVAHDGLFGSVQMELSLAVRLKKGNEEWSWCEAVRCAHQRLIRNYVLEGGVK